MVRLAEALYVVHVDVDGVVWAEARDAPGLVVALRGSKDALRAQLAAAYFDAYGRAPGSGALTDALLVVEGKARRKPPVTVELRTARHDGALYIDLGAPGHARAVKVTPGGWSVVDRSQVLFRRPGTMRALPVPSRGGSLDPWRGLLNVDDGQFRLLVGWLLAAYLPDIPRPILALFGQQGSAKTTTMRQVARLVDPSDILSQTMPREDAWGATGASSYVIGLDNVSSFSPWAQDALCKAVTGEAVTKRALYTNNELATVKFRRAIALTGITPGKLQGDLADRMLPVEIRPITPGTRRTETDVETAFTTAQPAVFGALLDLLASVLAALPEVEAVNLPRMADFALVLRALDTVTGWDTATDYLACHDDAAHAVVAGDEFAVSVVTHARTARVWEGTAGQLLHALTPPERPSATWPKTPEATSAALKRFIPALASYDVIVTPRERTRAGRGWRIVYTPTDQPPTPHTPTLEEATNHTTTPTVPDTPAPSTATTTAAPDAARATNPATGGASGVPTEARAGGAARTGRRARPHAVSAPTATATGVGVGVGRASPPGDGRVVGEPWCGVCGEPLTAPGLTSRCRPEHTARDDGDPGG